MLLVVVVLIVLVVIVALVGLVVIRGAVCVRVSGSSGGEGDSGKWVCVCNEPVEDAEDSNREGDGDKECAGKRGLGLGLG